MFQIDSVLGTSFFGVNGIVRPVVEYHAVLQYLAHGGSLVGVCRFQDFHRPGGIRSHGTGKEMTTRSET